MRLSLWFDKTSQSLVVYNYVYTNIIVVVVIVVVVDDDSKLRKKIQFKMKKSDWFECHGNLILAIKIDPSALYVRAIVNLLHCSILIGPN